ncbi:Acetyltransferase [Acaryochloris thomasi RCC1774]|uniref:Acetyltransferase n=1 Tax=Acaryochloris thomasi RCC1774 TaxID=1764569 RepID=A0A2W1JV44_9CYAN|nr:GNAT family N-acetyltransferase [Acaryochloris thomasi]PZD73624.1 Acetyltransferase [Acaryochloris thomasi RCC1774]
MVDLKIEVAFDPQPNEIEFVGQQLTHFNRSHAGESNYRRLAIFLRDTEQQVVGGLVGETSRQWLHVDMLWVHETFRRRGYGSILLSTAEQEAIKQDCRYAYLDTFSFQAPDFYQKCGYVVFGELPDFPEGRSRFFLKKELQRVL